VPAAQEFGLPLLPPSKAKNASFAQGANLAVTGATALDTDFFQKRGLGKFVWNSGSLFTQIQWLRDLKPTFCNSTQGTKIQKKKTDSLRTSVSWMSIFDTDVHRTWSFVPLHLYLKSARTSLPSLCLSSGNLVETTTTRRSSPGRTSRTPTS
jgi:hypothetical protein